MSGHSKWANIKHKKAKTDAARGVSFAKFSREIIIAAKIGGEDINGNFRLRTAVEKITGETLGNVEFTDVRGMEGIKEATYDVKGLKVKVAVASGLKNARDLCDKVKAGEADYQFIEIMSCPGGCVNGGGQPFVDAFTRSDLDYKALRAKGLYNDDANKENRKSHDNASIKALYDNFFGEVGGHKAHELLHTHYEAKK